MAESLSGLHTMAIEPHLYEFVVRVVLHLGGIPTIATSPTCLVHQMKRKIINEEGKKETARGRIKYAMLLIQ